MDKDVKQKLLELLNQMKSSQPEPPTDLVEKAFYVAYNAHQGQKRASGEEYIIHPLCVAKILADLQIDAVTICASLLHDVVEDTAVTLDEIEREFGNEVAFLVDGVTKLSRMEYKSKEEQQLENYRKMFLAMAKDIRVVLIKLADRLHNMRTLKHVPPEKQQRIASETMEIFAPLAHRLGMSNIKWEMEDLAFRYLEEEKYYELVEKVKQKRREREAYITQAVEILKQRLDSVAIKAEIQGRPKHFYSIYKKMQKSHKDLSEIYDLSAIRVVVDTIKDCYGVLGMVHTLWKPIPNRFKDYIAMPKSNMYQSLHTTVIGVSGQPLEIQIRTAEMHRTSEYGIAAHWRYKEGGKAGSKDFDQKLSWLRQLLEWQQEIRDPREFVETLKLDVFADEVFVFTPKGDVIDLPAGSVPIDFAYRVHTDVGHRCIGARVNGKMVPLEYRLKNGDIVEVITTKQGNGPSRDWLNIVGASETRNKIKQWFKKEKREENIAKGHEMLEKETKKLGYDWRVLGKSDRVLEVAKKFNLTTDELLASLGYGGHTLHAVMAKLVDSYKKEQKSTTLPDLMQLMTELKPKRTPSKASHGVLVKGENGLLVRLARCCNPVPGDEIIGFVTRGRGVSVHRADCLNILNNQAEFERMIEVSWDVSLDQVYPVTVEVTGTDRAGLLSDIMVLSSEEKINISTINAKVHKNKSAVITLSFELKNVSQLELVMTKIRRIKDVYTVQRSVRGIGGSA
ncbi:GTP pyrophosphokinase [Sporomusaceae bacterium BoRhaA]|uniref:RelA/SpoT family protein n=1 Tax=Pelorhabdus rhamnosifermentans TaxID=2772457 RepID=UPI001C061FB5|nr:bifunctional (p)ppGpp synthetase/guanosine-3',5'-bis(diphosphate) 3'-pyrophosphohydrolase [Pelorhabdus rhamnosifermentans]MBU2700899.1 GTP pyrophosphokinase [Pelorhabdus rhamnosifermentans]